MNKNLSIIGMGNAVLDIIISCSENDLANLNLTKGQMKIVTKSRSEKSIEKMNVIKTTSGGSVANTIAGIGILGGKSSFCGKVFDDDSGRKFIQNISDSGVDFLCRPAKTGPGTASCQVFVTKDGERTMQTFLGASVHLSEVDIEEKFFLNSSILFVEGYLWSSEKAREAIKKAIYFSKQKKILVAFSLSDSGLTKMYKNDFINFIKNDVDLLIGNENEIKSLTEEITKENILQNLKEIVSKTIMTSGENGATLFYNKEFEDFSATVNNNIIDSTGAGDMFAAGVLFKLNQGKSFQKSINFGCETAARILSQYGARPDAEIFSNF